MRRVTVASYPQGDADSDRRDRPPPEEGESATEPPGGGIVPRPVNVYRRLALAAALALVVASCGGGASPPPTSTTTTTVAPTVPPTPPTTAVIEPPTVEGTLTVWADPRLVDAVRAQGVLYTADTGIDVVVEAVSEADILAAVLDGEAGQPDVFLGPHTWLFELAVAGVTEPVRLDEGVPGGAADAVTLRTFTLAVPLALDALVEFRNPSILPARPEAVESIGCQGCVALPADGDLDVTFPFLASGGGYLFGPDPNDGYDLTDIGVDSAEAIATAAVLETMVAGGVVAVSADRAETLTRFAGGFAGIIWAGPEAIGTIPDEAVESLPTIGGSPAVSPVRVLAAYVNARGDLKSLATEFAERYLGGEAGSRAIADAWRWAPVWAAAATDAELVVIAAADTGVPVPYAPETEAAWDLMSAAFGAMLGGAAAETALIDAGDVLRFGGDGPPSSG